MSGRRATEGTSQLSDHVGRRVERLLWRDGEGKTFRVNSDAIALEVAESMQAMKILFLSAGNSLVIDGKLVSQLSIAETEDLVKKKRVLDAGLLQGINDDSCYFLTHS